MLARPVISLEDEVFEQPQRRLHLGAADPQHRLVQLHPRSAIANLALLDQPAAVEQVAIADDTGAPHIEVGGQRFLGKVHPAIEGAARVLLLPGMDGGEQADPGGLQQRRPLAQQRQRQLAQPMHQRVALLCRLLHCSHLPGICRIYCYPRYQPASPPFIAVLS